MTQLFGGGFSKQRLDTYRGEFNVRRFMRATPSLSNADTTTLKLQEAFDEAKAFALAYDAGVSVVVPSEKYFVSSQLNIQADGIDLHGCGPGGDTGTASASFITVPDFPANNYVLSFSNPTEARSLSGARLSGIRVAEHAQAGMALVNTVHGIYWQVYRGIMYDVYIQEMTGNGLTIQGYDIAQQAYQNYFDKVEIDDCDGDGIVILGDSPDMHFTDLRVHGNRYGYVGGIGSNRFVNCHWWQHTHSILANAGAAYPMWANCSFRESTQDNFVFDVSSSVFVTDFLISNCLFRTHHTLSADNTYDNFVIRRSSGGGEASGVLSNCVFSSVGGTVDVRYHVNLSGASAENVRLLNNRMDGNAVTSAINHATGATRCLVNGMGHNVGDPNSTGEWFGFGEEGIRVRDTGTGTRYEHNGTSWVAY